MKTYFVQSKEDDYGACLTELVQTEQELAEQYYYHKEVPGEDAETLKKYIDLVEFEEEKGRDEDQRFYGSH